MIYVILGIIIVYLAIATGWIVILRKVGFLSGKETLDYQFDGCVGLSWPITVPLFSFGWLVSLITRSVK